CVHVPLPQRAAARFVSAARDGTKSPALPCEERRGNAFSLADRRGVRDATVAPQGVQAALKTDRCRRTDVALVGFSVVTSELDDVVGPGIVEAERRTEFAFNAEEALDGRIVGAELLFNIGRVHAQLFSFEQSKVGPASNV